MHGTIANGIYFKFESEKQKLRMGGGSWSINLSEIKGQPVSEIQYQTDKAVYRIPFSRAISKGFEVNLGGENKLVVPIKWWSCSTSLT